jgi:hypothetical protein
LVSQSQEHFSEKATHQENGIKLMEKTARFLFILLVHFLASFSDAVISLAGLRPLP